MEKELENDELIDPEKRKHSKRIQKTQNHINKQLEIVKSKRGNPKYTKQPHRLAKHNAMDCGRPGCMLCGNPRKTLEMKTIQELKFEQTEKWNDYESETDKSLTGT